MTATLREAIQPYLDPHGLVAPSRGGGSNNGILYTSIYYILLALRGELTPTDRRDFVALMKDCEVRVLGQAYTGCYNRHPPNDPHRDQEGPDDYIGMAAASHLLGVMLAEEILDYGRAGVCRLPFVYNNVAPGTLRHDDGRINWDAMLGRQPQLIAHFYFSAGEMPPLFFRLVWAAVVATSGKKGDQDSWVLSWLLTLSAEGMSKPCDWAIVEWRRRLLRAYPGGMGEMMKTYLEPGHPFGEYFVDSIESAPHLRT